MNIIKDRIKLNQKQIPGKGLGTTLLISFLVLSLLPMTLVGYVSYQNAYNNIKKNAESALISAIKLRSEQIEYYFDAMVLDLELESERKSNTAFLESLINAYKKSKKEIKEFTRSYKWALITEKNGADLKTLRRKYNYYDLFLIGADGDILFTVAKEDDFGTNLFHGKYSNTLFASACKTSFKTGRMAFSDYEIYEPSGSGNRASGFLIAPIVNDAGSKIGLIAFQFSLYDINRIMQSDLGLGKTAEAYLIGSDLKLRTESVIGPEDVALETIIKTKQALFWAQGEHIKKQIEIGEKPGPIKEEQPHTAFLYQGPHNRRMVLGTHSGFDIKGVAFGVIAEIEEKEAFASVRSLQRMVITLMITSAIIVALIAFVISRRIVHPVKLLTNGAKLVAKGNLEHQIAVQSANEIGELTKRFNEMTHKLFISKKEEEKQNWLKEGLSELDNILRGEKALDLFAEELVTFICNHINTQIGLLYIRQEKDIYQLAAGFAVKPGQKILKEFKLGEGLMGQAAVEKKIKCLSNVPHEYFTVSSALGEIAPVQVLIVPFVYNDKVEGLIELGMFEPLSGLQKNFLEAACDRIALVINSVRARIDLDNALNRTMKQTKALMEQQEELAAANEELEEQTQLLTTSEDNLQKQQEELQLSNEELEEKTQYLERNKKEIEDKNKRLEAFQVEINKKAEDLATASKYKSEFLANMSHELRTPLNSLLLLAKLLSDNKEKNLKQDQLESVKIIYNSGNDLLSLINEILDLSKIEAGKMVLDIREINLRDIGDYLHSSFKHMAEEKGLKLDILFNKSCPPSVSSDFKRIEQILKNLISNAVKFTEKGGIQIEFFQPDGSIKFSHLDLKDQEMFAVAVKDTGIGIPEDRLRSIFEAFQQVEGGISRKYGGTGLGLSISKELARLLGGEIQLESTPETGSVFTLYLPVFFADKTISEEKANGMESREPIEPLDRQPLEQQPSRLDKSIVEKSNIPDDRNEINETDKSVLIIEDDLNFGKILVKLCREKGFKCLFSATGENGLLFAEEYLPKAIILDIHLPGIDGWTVLNTLKANSATRHIPVHFMSVDEPSFDAFSKGAIGFFTKPVSDEKLEELLGEIDLIISKQGKDLLVVEDNDIQRKVIIDLIGNSDVITDEARTGEEALNALCKKEYDCMILDLGLPDMTGFELLEKIKKSLHHPIPPIIVYTGRDLTFEQENTLRSYSESIIIKGVRSEERLLDETSLFLHRVVEKMPAEKKKIIADIHDSDQMMSGKNILIVDDDMRNVFALTKVLTGKAMNIVKAENGKKALSILKTRDDIDLVLMDIMMPVMDGYETMKKIRENKQFASLPIIALTAKAMKQDKTKCIQAGANDYLPKPVDISRLLSMMRVWLYN